MHEIYINLYGSFRFFHRANAVSGTIVCVLQRMYDKKYKQTTISQALYHDVLGVLHVSINACHNSQRSLKRYESAEWKCEREAKNEWKNQLQQNWRKKWKYVYHVQVNKDTIVTTTQTVVVCLYDLQLNSSHLALCTILQHIYRNMACVRYYLTIFSVLCLFR